MDFDTSEYTMAANAIYWKGREQDILAENNSGDVNTRLMHKEEAVKHYKLAARFYQLSNFDYLVKEMNRRVGELSFEIATIESRFVEKKS